METVPRMAHMLQARQQVDRDFARALQAVDAALVTVTRTALRSSDPAEALEHCWELEEQWAALLKEVDGTREMLENLAALMALADAEGA